MKQNEKLNETSKSTNTKQNSILHDLKYLIENDIQENETESTFFITCFDPVKNEIFFSDFLNEKILQKNEKIADNDEISQELDKRCAYFKETWTKIKEVSNLDEDLFTFNSNSTHNFFQRPLSSKFLNLESKGINHFTSTYPLPQSYLKYNKINLSIDIDPSVVVSEKEKLTFNKSVGFLSVVDTIIKETLKSLKRKLIELEEKDKFFELEDKLKNRKYKFVLKFLSFEEYMFGDYPISTYENVRGKIREFETIKCALLLIEKNKANPNNTNYPPIIYVPPNHDYNYFSLAKQYLSNYPEDSIIYRYIPSEKLKRFYNKINYSRKERLTEYCDSGESDFPFTIKLLGIQNIESMKKIMDTPEYHESEIVLPYFLHLPTVAEKNKKKNIFLRMTEKICCYEKVKEILEENEIVKKKKKEEHGPDINHIMKKYKENLKMQHKLNYLLSDKEKKEKHKNLKKLIGLFFNNTIIKNKLNAMTKIPLVQPPNTRIEKRFELQNYALEFIPTFLRLEVFLMYGSNEKCRQTTRIYLFGDNIVMNEKLNFDNLLISNIPRETRICIDLVCYDKDEMKNFILGSCSTPIFNENGVIEKSRIELYIWPLYRIDPRLVCMPQFSWKLDKENNQFNKNDYCILTIELPKFQKKLANLPKTNQSYREFLSLKYPKRDIDCSKEILSVYSSSMKDLNTILNTSSEKCFYVLEPKIEADEKKNLLQRNLTNSADKNIWKVMDYCLSRISSIIYKNPLDNLTDEEKSIVLMSRDYICTIPTALEVFLKSIDWFNPLQANLGRLYLKKWSKIHHEDAICLLDANYPDTHVRQYAVSILSEMSDDLINLYMLQMCQSLMYELYHVSPLGDMLIEKSLKSPNLIGNSFYWNSVVSMKNIMFKERLSLMTTYILMNSGPSFINKIFKSKNVDRILKNIASSAKVYYNAKETAAKGDKKKLTEQKVRKEVSELQLENFQFPIDPTYFAKGLETNKCGIFGSKMVPINLSAVSSDGSHFNVIYKCGDDLRQDVLTLQILKIMDKLWLDADIDLKITAYKVMPTGMKEGFIEFVSAKVIDSLQQKEGVSGALDHELLLKHLKSVSMDGNEKKYDMNNQHDNFIKSLAGFCVATCVLGIGDRHPGNVMLKNNGIFFHIDYGHILGNFKYKFGIKRERAPFLLTPEMAHVYIQTQRENEFKDLCVRAYLILRKNASRLINLFIIMSSAGLPELSGIQDVVYLKEMLKLDMKNDEDAGNYFRKLITQSKNEKFRVFDNIIHNWKHMEK